MLEIRRKSIAKAQMRLRTSCRRFLILNGSLNSSGAVCPIPTFSFQFSPPLSHYSDTFLFSSYVARSVIRHTRYTQRDTCAVRVRPKLCRACLACNVCVICAVCILRRIACRKICISMLPEATASWNGRYSVPLIISEGIYVCME